MKCALCDGKGKYINGLGVVSRCYFCLGTGEVNDKCERVKTEQEWLQTTTTEQLAEFLAGIINTNPCGYLLSCNECGLNDRCREDDYPTSAEAWVEWLKQPHLKE